MNHCPHCKKPLKLVVQKGVEKKTNTRPKKDPYEPMSLEQFVAGCLADKKVHINIIGHWAEELRKSCKWEGLQTRGEWVDWLNKNLKAASHLSYTWSADKGPEKVAKAMQLFIGAQKTQNFTSVNLSTLIKYVEKI